jgi:hypothetical protein
MYRSTAMFDTQDTQLALKSASLGKHPRSSKSELDASPGAIKTFPENLFEE